MRTLPAALLLLASIVVAWSWSNAPVASAQDTAPQAEAPQEDAQPAPEEPPVDPATANRQAIENLQRGERSALETLSGSQQRAIDSLRNSQNSTLGTLQRGERLPDDDAGQLVPAPPYGQRVGGGQPRRRREQVSRQPLPQPNLDRLDPNLTALDYLQGGGAFSYFGPRYANFAGPGQNFISLPPTSIGFVPDGMGGVTPAFGGVMMQNGPFEQGLGFVPDGFGGFQTAPYIIPPVTPGPIDAWGLPMNNYPYSNLPLAQPIGYAPVSTGPGMFGIQPIFDPNAANGVIPPDPAAQQAALEATGLLPAADAPQALDRPDDHQQMKRAIAAFRDRRYREALRQLDMAAAASPLDGSIELLRAQTFFAQSDFDQAAAALDRALATLPEKSWGSVLTENSQYYFERNLYSRQLTTLEGFVRRYPKDIAARYLLGYHLGFQGRAADAARELEAAIELGRRDPQTEQLYVLFSEEAKRQAAEEAARKAAEKPATSTEAEPVRFDSGQHEM